MRIKLGSGYTYEEQKEEFTIKNKKKKKSKTFPKTDLGYIKAQYYMKKD